MRLSIQNIEFGYGRDRVLDNISLELNASEIVAVCGPNGVGKSSLIKCISLILNARGRICIDGRDIKKMNKRDLARKIGYVPQYIPNVFSLTVFEMVLMGRRPHLGWKSSRTDRKKVVEALSLMGIEALAMRDFNELSGGQQQKVIIARALAQEPDILLMDEPTSNLDLKHQLEVMALVRKLAATQSISAIMALHDLNLAARYADRIIVMKGGQIFCQGDAGTVLTPANIQSVYGVKAVVRQEADRPYIVPLDPTL